MPAKCPQAQKRYVSFRGISSKCRYFSYLYILYIAFLGFFLKMPLLRGQQRKGIYLFYACGYLPLIFFNHTKTMRLMPSCKQIPDFLSNSRTCVFLQNAEKCIESFFYFYNDKLFSHKLIHAFSVFQAFSTKSSCSGFSILNFCFNSCLIAA